jgi:hypothetical protein
LKIELMSPVASMSGHTSNSQYVLVKRGKITYARAYSPPSNPQSRDQVLARKFLVTATKSWGSLTSAQRESWDRYASAHYVEEGPTGIFPKSGYNVYSKVQYYRQAMDLGLMFDAPRQAPPAAPRQVLQEVAAGEAEFRFRLLHDEPDVVGFHVLFEITPAMPSPGRKPRHIELRMVRNVGPNSFLPLLLLEESYVIVGAQFAVAAAKRYGVRARIITPDGVPSLPVSGDFLKEIGWVQGVSGSNVEAVQSELF